jgi:hypothetical protein
MAANIRKWPSSTAGTNTCGSSQAFHHITAPNAASAYRLTTATVRGFNWNMPKTRITINTGNATPRTAPAMA